MQVQCTFKNLEVENPPKLVFEVTHYDLCFGNTFKYKKYCPIDNLLVFDVSYWVSGSNFDVFEEIEKYIDENIDHDGYDLKTVSPVLFVEYTCNSTEETKKDTYSIAYSIKNNTKGKKGYIRRLRGLDYDEFCVTKDANLVDIIHLLYDEYVSSGLFDDISDVKVLGENGDVVYFKEPLSPHS
jgi:hypothetical protein